MLRSDKRTTVIFDRALLRRVKKISIDEFHIAAPFNECELFHLAGTTTAPWGRRERDIRHCVQFPTQIKEKRRLEREQQQSNEEKNLFSLASFLPSRLISLPWNIFFSDFLRHENISRLLVCRGEAGIEEEEKVFFTIPQILDDEEEC